MLTSLLKNLVNINQNQVALVFGHRRSGAANGTRFAALDELRDEHQQGDEWRGAEDRDQVQAVAKRVLPGSLCLVINGL